MSESTDASCSETSRAGSGAGTKQAAEDQPLGFLHGDSVNRIGEPFHRFQALKPTALSDATSAFSEFREAMIQRMEWEDHHLFREFADRVGVGAESITGRLRQEHLQIRQLLDAIAGKLAHSDPDTEREERELENLLSAHNHHEHKVIYAAFEN